MVLPCIFMILYLSVAAMGALLQTAAVTARTAELTLSLSGSAVDSFPKASPVLTVTAVLQRALNYTGFDDYTAYSFEKGNVLATLIGTDQLDYNLFREECSAQVWRIVFKGVRLPRIASGKDAQSRGERNYEVLIDASSGKLLRIHSVLDEKRRNPQDSLPLIEKQLRSYEQVRFVGLPDTLPEHPFLAILKSAISNPTIPNEIIAYYVYHTQWDEKPRRVWSIDLRGIPPEYSPGLPASEQFSRPKMTNFRRVWEAATGKLLFGMNAP